MAGDILSFHVFGQVVVVLNSIKTTKDLLERRGDIYSDRPPLTIYEMCVISSFASPAEFDKVQDEVALVRACCKIH